MTQPIEYYDTYELERPQREAKKRRQQEARESEQEEKWIEKDREKRKSHIHKNPAKESGIKRNPFPSGNSL